MRSKISYFTKAEPGDCWQQVNGGCVGKLREGVRLRVLAWLVTLHPLSVLFVQVQTPDGQKMQVSTTITTTASTAAAIMAPAFHDCRPVE